MTLYQQLIHVLKETCPESLVELYRHPNGNIVQFRYTDHAYMGLGPQVEHAPALPESWLPKIPKEDM